MRVIRSVALFSLLYSLSTSYAFSCNKNNFSDRKAYIINLSPGLELTHYDFCNTDGPNYQERFIENLSWKNTGSQDVISFEILTDEYDPFNRSLIGSKGVFAGKSSANWTPLHPGETSEDGLVNHGTSYVYTGIAYVGAVRYADGKVWIADPEKVAEAIKQLGIEVKELKGLGPDKPQNHS